MAIRVKLSNNYSPLLYDVAEGDLPMSVREVFEALKEGFEADVEENQTVDDPRYGFLTSVLDKFQNGQSDGYTVVVDGYSTTFGAGSAVTSTNSLISIQQKNENA